MVDACGCLFIIVDPKRDYGNSKHQCQADCSDGLFCQENLKYDASVMPKVGPKVRPGVSVEGGSVRGWLKDLKLGSIVFSR